MLPRHQHTPTTSSAASSASANTDAAREVRGILHYYLDECTRARAADEWKKIKEKGALQLFQKKRVKRQRVDGTESDSSMVSATSNCSSLGSSSTLALAPPVFTYHGVTTLEGCSLHDIQSLLCVRQTSDFRATMKLLHGNDFVDGAILSSSPIDASVFSTVNWFALKSSTVLAKDKGFCMRSYAHIVGPPNAAARTLVWTLQPMHHPTPNLLYHVNKYKRMSWELGLVVEEVAPHSLRVSCRCQSSDKRLMPAGARVVWNMLSQLQPAILTLQASKVKSLVAESQWIKDDDRPSCLQCDAEFTTFRRRHHCRTCGEVVCAACSSIHIVALARGPMKIRMCAKCLERDAETPLDDARLAALAGRSSHSFQSTARSSSMDGLESAETFSLLRIADALGQIDPDA
ncbi:hypothetical protein SDRG_07994 [Saprolegnia diclina VS20]|uniref:FYVE-type domain-containing protein n=1 Tax=Saprolegnia diclina (strain VS20) TaxID=1156394 RepID=T0QIX9_SAPDV|nr:hypothetical protein SDRG_07994 [Saprolegnia diclina VS20]EQC34676.1 hypothetical protein SDRG_07994 [Saprolegnia diclina VS20]|eukprot:XP_008612082.1 hypothetical protein SDRG_07994 [Saprolegnia diclina VS20]